ncbi:MAG: 2Fe-2S iron-sulfur cluster-binding protein [Lachnoclostridium sp.]
MTIEGIGKAGLSIIQRCFLKVGAVQCGYCTPGMIMATTTILKENRHPDKVEIKEDSVEISAGALDMRRLLKQSSLPGIFSIMKLVKSAWK